MTALDAALGGALIAVVCYRIGWTIGAGRMARAIQGRPATVAQRFEAWRATRRQRAEAEDESGDRVQVLDLKEALRAALDEGRRQKRHEGPYL